MTKALLVIDIQNDYFPGGKMELVGALAAGENAAKLQRHFRELGLPVIHVQHIALSPSATFFLPETYGAQINDLVVPIGDEVTITKHFPNSFRETKLQQTLDELGVTELTVVGMMTHMCIDTTVRAASEAGFTVTLVGDACATKDLEFEGRRVAAVDVQASFLAAIDGSFATVVVTDVLVEN
ncbi:MAG: cysteine hydrolase family protein [Rhodoluna sp.]